VVLVDDRRCLEFFWYPQSQGHTERRPRYRIVYRNSPAVNVSVVCQMTGDMVPVDVLSVVGIPNLKDRLTELVRRVRELRLDLKEYICLKYILLLNPGLSAVVVVRVRCRSSMGPLS